MMLWLARFLFRTQSAPCGVPLCNMNMKSLQTELTEGSRILGYTSLSADCGLSEQASAVEI